MTGRPAGTFSYHDKGIMATIGRRSAVVELPKGVRIRGTLAWLAWLGLHLITLLGGRNRLSALLNLSYRYLVWGHGAGVIVGDDPPSAVPGGPSQQVPGADGAPRQVPGADGAPQQAPGADGAPQQVPGADGAPQQAPAAGAVPPQVPGRHDAPQHLSRPGAA